MIFAGTNTGSHQPEREIRLLRTENFFHSATDDFVVIESDGSLLNKEEFLRNTIKGPDVADYKLHEVDIRIYGSAALVRATLEDAVPERREVSRA